MKEILGKGYSLKLCFLAPDNQKSQFEMYNNQLSIVYLWKSFFCGKNDTKSRCYNKALYQLSLIVNSLRFRHLIKKGDVVYTYSLLPSLPLIMGKKGVRYYNEQTELPMVSGLGSHLYHISLNKCIKYSKKLDGLIVISEALKQFYINSGVLTNKIHVINMIVDSSRFEYLVHSGTRVKTIVYCGAGFTNDKDGVVDLVKAFSKINRSEGDIKLLLVGNPGNEEVKEEIDDIIGRLGMTDDVIITGRVLSKDIPQILKDASVLVLCRPDNMQAKYGFPTKLGEYLLSGNPVVATNVGDIHLYLEDGVDIMLATPGNLDEFAHKINQLLVNKELASLIGKNGQSKALQFFNCNIETEKLIGLLYDSI